MKQLRRLFRRSSQGWTFMETLIVIGIVLVLTSLVGFMAFRYLDQAKTTTARSQIEIFSLALNAYYLDMKAFPSEQEGLEALWTRPGVNSDRWRGPYVAKPIPADPWDRAYEYRVPGPQGLPFGLRSYGADGLEGGEGMDADVTSWN